MSTRTRKKIVRKNTRKYGIGVFADQDIAKGEIIHEFGGKKVGLKEIVDRILSGKEIEDDPLQIGRRTYIDLDSMSRSFNHSCDPNANMKNRSTLFALRDIKKGEEITFDYSATIMPTDWEMPCKCGSKKCRKTISDVRSIPKAQLDMYLQNGGIQRYMKPIIQELRAHTYTMPRYEQLALQKLHGSK